MPPEVFEALEVALAQLEEDLKNDKKDPWYYGILVWWYISLLYPYYIPIISYPYMMALWYYNRDTIRI